MLQEEGKAMHILHVSSATTWRGGEQQLAYLAKELDQKGIRQTILCASDSPMASFCKKEELDYITCKKKTALGINFSAKIKKIAKELKVTMVHTHDAHAHTFAFLANILFNARLPLIVSRRVDFPIKTGVISKWKYNDSSVVKILCVSDAIKHITGKDIQNTSVLKTIYSCIDTNKFQPKTNILHQEFGLERHVKLIGNVSAIAPHKDYYTFIDVAEKVIAQRKNVVFLIIGDGPSRDEIKAYASTKNLNNQLIFTGFRSDIEQVLPALDIFLITSQTEGLGTSILDAFAANVPVIATMAGGIPEIVIHRETGLLADIKHVDRLSQNCLTLLDDTNLQQHLRNNAKHFVEKFNPSALASNTLKEYQEVWDNLVNQNSAYKKER